MDKDELFKEIDLLQSCISRMAQNSFMIKGWALTLFAGATVFTKGANLGTFNLFLFTTFIPFICFWVLDTFYLHTEMKYRKMYEDMLEKRKVDNLEGQYGLNPRNVNCGIVFKTMFSFTLVVFYGIPTLTCMVFILIKFIIF